MNDDELEDMFRSSLSDHAAEAVPPADPVAAAHAGVRRRRRVVAAIAGAAAVVVIAPAAVVAVALGQGGSKAADVSGVVHPAALKGWRVESYNGIELRVPPDWGWGWNLFGCQPEGGYVGRPFAGTLSCADARTTDDSHVWFDSHGPVASSEGEVTVHVKGPTGFNITVADPDAAQLQRILDSIHPVATDSNGCPQKPARIPWDSQDPNLPNPTSASVCIYYASTSAPDYRHFRVYLYYSTRMDTSVPELVDAINAGGPGPRTQPLDACGTSSGMSSVELIVKSDVGSTTYAIPSMVCGGQGIGYNTQPGFHMLTKRSVALWAINGVPVYAENGRTRYEIGGYLR